MYTDSHSRVVDFDAGESLKVFGQLLLAKIWQQVDKAATSYPHRHVLGSPWLGFESVAYRTVLGVMADNCSRERGAPSIRRWPSLSLFLGPGKGFQVEIKNGHVVLLPTPELARAFDYNERLISPFRLKLETSS